jgi:hypothetical protein
MSDQTSNSSDAATHFVGIVNNNFVVQIIGATDRVFAWMMSNPKFVCVTGIEEKLVPNQTTYDSATKLFTKEETEEKNTLPAPKPDVVAAYGSPDSGVMHYLACIIENDVVDIMGIDDDFYRFLTNNVTLVNVTGIERKIIIGDTKYDASKNELVNPDNTTIPVPAIGNIALLG